MHKAKKDLENFYDQEHKKFHNTRKKTRPEFYHIAKYINNNRSKDIQILELGCGDGRLLKFLKKHTDKNISYTGIDLSKKLLGIGKENYQDAKFIHGDMVEEVQKQGKERFDFIIAVASFQHLPTKKERIATLNNCYHSLKYGGSLIMVNRSFSLWFIKKFRKQLCKNFFFGAFRSLNDVHIPRKGTKKKGTYYRYYHIFTPLEIKKLFKKTAFSKPSIYYMSKAGLAIKNRKHARNTITISKKSILKD